MAEWKRDEGYSCCKTAYFGEIAVVICEPEYEGDTWGYQAFDESDEAALNYGETCAEEYGFKSESDVIRFVEETMGQ